MAIATHYERLGVSPTASAAEIRAAYRRLARQHHPDARGGQHSTEMAAINEAWRVLSDPVRRVRYDAGLRAGPGASPTSVRRTAAGHEVFARTQPRHDPFRRYVDPPRFPWRFVLVVIALGVAAVVAVGAFVDPAAPGPVDNLIQAGSCVVLDEVRNEATEVPCDSPHDATVERLVPFDAVCPSATESYRDRQGMGQACVRRV